MSDRATIFASHWEAPDHDGDASGVCTCGDEWPCDVELVRRSLTRAPVEPPVPDYKKLYEMCVADATRMSQQLDQLDSGPPVLSRAALDEMIKTVRVELGQEGFNIDEPWDLFWRGTDKLRDAILESLSQEEK